VEAYVSIFNNVDRMGDRVIKGAFTKSLAEWRARKQRIPVTWMHGEGIRDVVGSVTSAVEDDIGLRVTMQLDMNTNEDARTLFDAIKSGSISQYSFGYRVLKSRAGKDGALELVDLDLLHVSPVISGANADTRTISAKQHGWRPPVLDEQHLLGRALDAQVADFETLRTRPTTRVDTTDAQVKAMLDAMPKPKPKPKSRAHVVAGSSVFATGSAAVGGYLHCAGPDCPTLVDLDARPSGYCPEHAHLEAREVVRMNASGSFDIINPRAVVSDIDVQIARAEQHVERLRNERAKTCARFGLDTGTGVA
jgi:HK97 family phage prohead protease